MKKYLITLALFGGFNQVASANLIVNGSFEDYTVAPNTTAHVASDCSTATVSNCIDLNSSDPWQPTSNAPNVFLEVRDGDLLRFPTSIVEIDDTPFGNVYAEINPVSSTGSGFQQTFSAAVGTGDLSWYDYARSTTPHYQVFLNDMVNPIYDSSLFSTSYTDWTQRSVFGVNLLDTNVLSFVSVSTDTISANIDNIVLTQVSAVPEPESYAMFLAGLGLLGFANRKKTQK